MTVPVMRDTGRTAAEPENRATDDRPAQELPPKELPFAPGLPLVGHTFDILRDPVGWGARMRAQHGDIFAFKAFFRTLVAVGGPDALETVWLDRAQDFSSRLAYSMVFGHLTNTSVLTMDFEEHRYHRQLLTPAFKAAALRGYLSHMNAAFAAALPGWADVPDFRFYPAIKALTLEVASDVFLGFETGGDGPADRASDRARVNKALSDILAASLAVVRAPLPFTRTRKSLKAQRYIDRILAEEIPRRRARGGDDMFSRLCALEDTLGNALPDAQIIGHLKTIWIAGHDTLASSLTTLVCQLGLHQEWQDRLLDEIRQLPARAGGPSQEDINSLDLCTCAFKEALRMVPAAVDTPRVAVRDVELMGYRIPAGRQLSLSLYALHNSPDWWPEPEKFDPMRFAPGALNGPKDGLRTAWAPFGGGAHKCIGMNFALIQARAFLVALLPRYRIELEPGYRPDIQLLPTPRPRDGLPVKLVPR